MKSEALVDISLKKKQIFEGTIYLQKSCEEYQKLKKKFESIIPSKSYNPPGEPTKKNNEMLVTFR